MKTKRLHLTLLAAFAAIAAGCSEKKSADTGDTASLAQVGGQTVTEADFLHAWTRRPPREDNGDVRQELLDQLIERSALAEAAREAGLEEDPIVRDQIENLLIGRLREIELVPKLAAVSVSDDEVRSRFEALPSTQAEIPGQHRVAVLWFDTRGQQPLVDRYLPRLEEVRSQLVSDPDRIPVSEGFGQLANTYSEHRSSKFKGGDLGWLRTDRPMDNLRSAAAELAADLAESGDLSDVVARPEGIFLVRLMDRREPRRQEFADVEGRIREQLLRERRAQVEEQFHAGILERFPATRHKDRLAAIRDLPVATTPPASTPTPVDFTRK